VGMGLPVLNILLKSRSLDADEEEVGDVREVAEEG